MGIFHDYTHSLWHNIGKSVISGAAMRTLPALLVSLTLATAWAKPDAAPDGGAVDRNGGVGVGRRRQRVDAASLHGHRGGRACPAARGG